MPSSSYQKLPGDVNVPGTSVVAKVMLPLRLVVVLIFWTLMYPLFLIAATLRALYLRLAVGKPSQILKYGTYNDTHMDDMHYPCHQLYKEPLDEARLRKALVELCAEDNITEDKIDLQFKDEKPNDWPQTGSFDIDYFIESNKRADNRGHHYWDYADERKARGEPGAFMKIHVFNGLPGKPTVMYYFGSGNKWDGSSNFNFVRELMNRYMGNTPNKVFQKPELLAASAEKFDQLSFVYFMLKMPFLIGKNWFCILWNITRAAKWAGGNGFGFKMTAMNFTKEESERLYAGCKKKGIKPFAALTCACVKACKEVLGQQPTGITQQASLQTRHYPMPGQTTRDLVGDWLFGPVQDVKSDYTEQDAMAGYKELNEEMQNVGPIMRDSIMAKAYGLFNSGAAGFELLPTYNCANHPLDRNLFMNNYGIRTMPEGSPFHTWNWNAPLWFGINTINVDGCTTTMVGSCFWGLDVVEVMRDNIEAYLRSIMAEAGKDSASIPTYKNPPAGA